MKEYKGNTWISKNKIYRKKKYANKEKSIEKDYYYEKSIKELTEYIMEDSFWDGYSPEEVIISEFESLDSNRDGFLSYDEFSDRFGFI